MSDLSKPTSIALIDDDQNIVTSVSIALEQQGWSVKSFHDGETGLQGITKDEPDLVVLDIKMPRMNGIEVLKKLRETSNLPVIFLTSKDDEIDEIIGLKMGADDYITKPFSQNLLIARIQTLLRRGRKNQANQDNNHQTETIELGPLTLDKNRYVCAWKAQPLDLTVTEFLLILNLAEHPGHVKSRDQLISAAYGDHIYVDDRTIDSHIKRIRKKFKTIDPDFNHIETIYGIGYKYKT
jgi:two-component system response regulator ChvI